MSEREIKLITLGNSLVGKSSYIIRYTDNEFLFNMTSTIGIDCKSKIETLDNNEKVEIIL